MSTHLDFPVRQEADEVAGARILHVLAVSAAVALLGVAASTLLLLAESRALSPTGVTARDRPPEPSRVEQGLIRTTQRGVDLHDGQRRRLDRWAWVNRSAGVGAIPIDEAADIVTGGDL